jgi:hypothetical protein
MVGRNEPCPCGSGKKFKKCCERVVTLAAAEKAREARESQLKNELLSELNRWFNQRVSEEKQLEWADRFKKLLQFRMDQPIPKEFSTSFRLWLLFDAPCLNRKRPVEVWSSTLCNAPQKERLARNFSESKFTCYEVVKREEEHIVLKSLENGQEYEVKLVEAITEKSLLFTRLLRIGNRYQIFGPYTSFVHEMRGEILVQLEKYSQVDEKRQDLTTWEKGWKVFGWSIGRAEELEQVKAVPSAAPEPIKGGFFWPMAKEKEEDLPPRIMLQLEQFFIAHVALLQKGTQKFYSRTLEWLYKYLSMRYGQAFDWNLLNEDALIHFVSVWYLDNAKISAKGARIFLNTLKYLFRWLEQEEISGVYRIYKQIYVSLIRTLPEAVEMRKWLMESKEHETSDVREQDSEMVLFAISSSGPVILADGKWQPVHLSGSPSVGAERRYWVRGVMQKTPSGYTFTRVDGVYPVVLLDKQVQVSGNK